MRPDEVPGVPRLPCARVIAQVLPHILSGEGSKARRFDHDDLGGARPPVLAARRGPRFASAARRIDVHADERAVLVHGDVRQWNTLETEDGFKLNPDGLLAEAEHDMGILVARTLWNSPRADAHKRARWLALRCGFDAAAIWEWGVVERVSTGLLCTSIGLQPVGREMLAVADRVAE